MGTCRIIHNLTLNHLFVPVVIEVTGVLGPETASFLKELSNCLWQVTRDEDTYHHLLQRLSMAVQRGNSVLGLGGAGGFDMLGLIGH